MIICFIDENLGIFNTTRNDSREQVMAAGITDEALLSGDLNTVEQLVYNNETLVWINPSTPPLNYYNIVSTIQRSMYLTGRSEGNSP